MLPVLSREVVEGKQRVAILDQALDSLVVFDAPDFDEVLPPGECIRLVLAIQISWMRMLGFRSPAPGRPASAHTDRRPGAPNSAGRVSSATSPDRLPEAEGAVGDRKLGSHRKPPPFEVEEELFPRSRALADAVD